MFVDSAPNIYGETFNVYNVHSLVHLVDDVQYFESSLNEISAFKFENYMQTVKKSVKNSSNPVSQIVKRLKEKEIIVDHQENRPPKMKTAGKDSCFMTEDGVIVFIKSIQGNTITCDVLSKRAYESFYNVPVESSILMDIHYVRNFSSAVFKRKSFKKQELLRKCVQLPHKNGYIFFPLLHNFENNYY